MRVKHRNIILEIVKEAGISPKDFTITESVTEKDKLHQTTFKYKNSPFSFDIRVSNESYEQLDYRYVQYGPNFPFTIFFPENDFTDFDSVANEFEEWINEHILEYEEDQFEPDLWSEYHEGQQNVDINQIDFNDKSNFTIAERKQISLAINEVKFLIEKNFKPLEKQLILINERLDYLAESAQNLNKFDWKSLLFSTILGIATTLTLDTEIGKKLFELFRQVFSSIKIISK